MDSINAQTNTTNQSNVSEQNSGKQTEKISLSAIITPGEADESSEEEDDNHQHINDDNVLNSDNNYFKQSSDATNSTHESLNSGENYLSGDSLKYNTLLHQKLREKNEQLKRELVDLACGPYNTATKEVSNISKQLIQSQRMVQNVSASLRKVSKELISMGESIDSIRNNKDVIIGNIRKKTDATEAPIGAGSSFASNT